MASKTLKGLTIEIGGDTTKLGKALENVEKQGRDLSSELGQINKLLKLDPKNTELLAQKQKVLADAIKNTESKLDTLREAEKQVQAQFERGEVSEAQYRELQREIIATENKLNQYKNAVKETTETQEKLAKSADDASDELDDLDDSASDSAKGGLAAIAAAAAAAVASIVALAESSREYRTEMGKLDTAFTDNSFSAEAATKTYEALQSILGETEQAVEASNNLAALCTTEEELSDWTEILTGVYGKFGASLPVEGLAEAANETKRVGQVTGPLADALNWAAKEGETFGVVMKEATEENEEWNKAVSEATSAEEYFNLALQECSSEQERQQLITSTLTDLYGSAAKQYKKTNEEVIRANKATEKWNKATAKIGKTVEPVVTDIKKLGATLLEDVSGILERIAKYIQKTVIPTIEKVSKWVKKNLPAIKSGLVGVAAAMVAFKVATIATTVAQKGLKGAIVATTIAQKALALAQSATPWGLAAVAIAAVVTALVAYVAATRDAVEEVDVLTKEERELMAAADEAAEAFRDQKKSIDENLRGITAQMDYTSDLADELFTLADASGKVKEEDKARANFIINELNGALGTEYTMVGNVIQQYKDLKASIDELILAKRANSLLEAANAGYVEAIQKEEDALTNLNLKEQDYQAQLEKTTKVQGEAGVKWAEYHQAVEEVGAYWAQGRLLQAQAAQESANKEKAVLAEKKDAYDQAAQDYALYYNTIANYEEAQTAALSGNYQKTADILSKKGGAYNTYSDKVDEETAKVLDTLYKEALDAGLEAERTRKNFENGVDGYTQEMVDEAEQGYQDALDEFANAYADAESVGEDLTDGMAAGAENGRSGLIAKARSLVTSFFNAVRDESDTHSPSRKAIAIFEDIGEGAEIGVKNKTKDVGKAGTEQAAAVLDAYRDPEHTGQRVFRNLAEQQSEKYAAGQMTIATANGPMLEKILTTLEKGQVLILDGDAVVGGTAAKMDNALGRRRALASRGAI